MTRHRWIAVLLVSILATLTPCVLFAQDAEQPPAQPPQRERPAKPDLDQPVPADQLAAARLMAQQGLKRLPDQLARQYNLTDEQKAAAGDILQNRWAAMPPADQDGLIRAGIYGQQLRRSGQAAPEDWQRLARESLPAAETMLKFIDDSAADFERVLDDEQRAKFNENMVQVRQGMDIGLTRARLIADGTVKLGADGEPTDGTSWPPEAELPGRRGPDVTVVEEEVEEVGPDGVVRMIKIKRIKSNLPDEATVAGNEKYWPPYVKGFIAKYGLTAEQAKATRTMLGEALKRAREYRDTMKAPLDQARLRIADAERAKDARALEAAQMGYDRLNEPVVRIFHDLQRKLDGGLTEPQRRADLVRGSLFAEPPKPTDQP